MERCDDLIIFHARLDSINDSTKGTVAQFRALLIPFDFFWTGAQPDLIHQVLSLYKGCFRQGIVQEEPEVVGHTVSNTHRSRFQPALFNPLH